MAGGTREGFSYGLVAYGWWGLVPLYFRWLRDVAPAEMLAHRVLWSLVLLAVVVIVVRRVPEVVHCLRTRRLLVPLTASALLVGVNWLVYIFSVASEQIVQASLGYYILPLASVLLGLAVFRERLRGLQWLALALAAGGVGLLTWASGEFPWIALTLAITFSLYGAVRKQTPVDGLVGLSVETVVLVPLAVAYLAVLAGAGESAVNLGDVGLLLKLALSGVVTAVPLLCFGQAARRLPLSVLGFLQYVSPTIQLLVAVWLFDERVPGESVVGAWAWLFFALIWAGLVIFTIDAVRQLRRRDGHAATAKARPARERVPAET